MVFRHRWLLSLLAAATLAGQAQAAPDRVTDAATPPSGYPAAVSPAWHWRLAGTLLVPGHREAVFAWTGEGAAGETRSVAEGGEIDGWTVAAVRPHGVTLARADAVRTLSMEGFSPEEEAAAAKLRVEQARRRNAAVLDTLARQEREIEAGSAALTEATQRMEAHQPQKTQPQKTQPR